MAHRLSRAARKDIVEIYLRSEEMFGEAQADRYLAGLYGVLAFLAENPRSARERIEFDPPVRVHPYKAHLVIYETDGDDVFIIRLRHGHEDWRPFPAGDD